MNDQNPPHVALFPAPVMGQVLPFIEFAKQLVHHHGFHVTCIIPTLKFNHPPPTAMVDAFQSLPPAIHHVFLPPPDLQDLPPDTKPMSLAFVSIARSLPSLRQVVQSLTETTRLVALVTCPPGTDAFDVAKEFNIGPYLLFTSGAAPLSSCFYFKKIGEMGLSLPEVIQMPGCVSFHKDDLLDSMQDPHDESFRWTLHMSKRLCLAEGILVNTVIDLEPGAMKALQEEEPGMPRLYPVGPLVRFEEKTVEDKSGCLKWLDNQPRGSVVFVSFGSGGTLSQTQTDELALGLEMSGQRFIWVVRPPNNETSNAAVFSVKTQTDPFRFLPKGFMERTKGVGLVVHSWAPQSEILSHGSTGGFISHCGWNSIQESVVNGVPIIAWPLYAEQKMNAVILTEDIKVAMRPKMGENGIAVMREEIARVVKELMEGNEGKRIRERMNELKVASRKALGHGGSSFDAVSELATKWKSHRV